MARRCPRVKSSSTSLSLIAYPIHCDIFYRKEPRNQVENRKLNYMFSYINNLWRHFRTGPTLRCQINGGALINLSKIILTSVM